MAAARAPRDAADARADAPEHAAGRGKSRAPSRRGRGGDGSAPHLAAALIVAHNQARRIAATVRAARSIPGVDLVLVVDDASTDNTQTLARKAGAVVVRHSHMRGRNASVETGSSVIAMRDEPGQTPRAVLLLPSTLGHHAVGAAPLVAAVTEHVADLAVALTDGGGKVSGMSSNVARKAVEDASEWTPLQPLGTIRCLTREALESAIPLARGPGLEVGMTLDVLQAGLTVTEVECDIRHRSTAGESRHATKRAGRYRDVMMAIGARRVRAGVDGTRRALSERVTRARRTSDENEDDQ